MSNAPIFLINLEGQSQIKAITETHDSFKDLCRVSDATMWLISQYLYGFTSLKDLDKPVTQKTFNSLCNLCDTKLHNPVNDGSQYHCFTLKFEDVTGKEHGITIQFRRTNVES